MPEFLYEKYHPENAPYCSQFNKIKENNFMIEFTKKNIKGIIDIINSEPCRTRPALQTMRVQRDGFAYITNGYLAIRWKFQTEPIPRNENQKEFVIPVDNLIRWYKLANSKDKLNELTILELQDEENTTIYPDISLIFKEAKKNNASNNITLNLHLIELVHHCTDCRNYQGFKVINYGKLLYGIENKRESIEFIVMPLNA